MDSTSRISEKKFEKILFMYNLINYAFFVGTCEDAEI